MRAVLMLLLCVLLFVRRACAGPEEEKEDRFVHLLLLGYSTFGNR
eukprot:gene1365-7147_t